MAEDTGDSHWAKITLEIPQRELQKMLVSYQLLNTTTQSWQPTGNQSPGPLPASRPTTRKFPYLTMQWITSQSASDIHPSF